MLGSSSLIVLHDTDDLACAEARCPEAMAGRVLAFDTDIHLTLSARGIPHLTPWDVIRPDEKPRVETLETAVWNHWHRHARIEFEGFNLLGLAAFRHISALARLVWVVYALGRVLDEQKPRTVYAFEEPPAHGLDQPPAYRKMPLLSGVLRWLADQRGCRIRLVRRPDEPAGAFRDLVASRKEHREPPVDVSAALGDGPFVLFHANNDDVQRQLPLIQALLARGDCRVVQLYRHAAPERIAEAAAIGHLLWHESQVAPSTDSPDIGSIAADAREGFNAAGRTASPELRSLFDNPFVASHFDFLFGPYANQMAWHVRAWRGFFAAHRPAIFVVNWHAPIYDVAAGMGVPCLGLTHALMMIGQPKVFTSLPEPSLIGAISELHRDRLVEAGITPARICVTGDPVSEHLVGQLRERAGRRHESPATCDGEPETLRLRLGIAPGRKVVLLCTGSFGMPAKTVHLPMTDWSEGVRCMEDLEDLLRRRSDWAFVLKCHPRFDYPDLYEMVNRRLPADRRMILTADEPLGPLCHLADVICVWNVVTSALVEASLLDKPVLLFDRALVWCDLKQWGIDVWPRVSSLPALETELDRLAGDPVHHAQRLRQTQRAVGRFLGSTADSSISRCTELISEHIASQVPSDLPGRYSCAPRQFSSTTLR